MGYCGEGDRRAFGAGAANERRASGMNLAAPHGMESRAREETAPGNALRPGPRINTGCGHQGLLGFLQSVLEAPVFVEGPAKLRHRLRTEVDSTPAPRAHHRLTLEDVREVQRYLGIAVVTRAIQKHQDPSPL